MNDKQNSSESSTMSEFSFSNNMEEMSKFSSPQTEHLIDWNVPNNMANIMQMSHLFPQLLNGYSTPREKELITAIAEIKKKIEVITFKRKESEMAVEHLNGRIENLETKLKNEGKGLSVSKHPTEEEVTLFERLKYMAKEMTHRNRIIKALEEQEKILKETYNFAKVLANNNQIDNRTTDNGTTNSSTI